MKGSVIMGGRLGPGWVGLVGGVAPFSVSLSSESTSSPVKE